MAVVLVKKRVWIATTYEHAPQRHWLVGEGDRVSERGELVGAGGPLAGGERGASWSGWERQSRYFSLRTNRPQQPASSTFLSEQISTNHQPPAKRTGQGQSLTW
jgi:hypothetical protein